MDREYLVEGWTERIREQLQSPPGTPFNLGAGTVELVVKDNAGATVTFLGTVGVETPSTGTVYFDPASGDLLASKAPYRVHWKVTIAGKVAFFPHKDAMQWFVRAPGT